MDRRDVYLGYEPEDVPVERHFCPKCQRVYVIIPNMKAFIDGEYKDFKQRCDGDNCAGRLYRVWSKTKPGKIRRLFV